MEEMRNTMNLKPDVKFWKRTAESTLGCLWLLFIFAILPLTIGAIGNHFFGTAGFVISYIAYCILILTRIPGAGIDGGGPFSSEN